MRTLFSIATETGTDKLAHDYIRHYDAHWSELRGGPLTILEIGVCRGCSLNMWREYFRAASIYGLDVDINCERPKGCTVVIGNQGQPETFASLLDIDWDIIIDDGSHNGRDQVISFNALFPKVKPGGWYVIEDLHASYWPGDQWSTRAAILFLHERWDDLNCRGKYKSGNPEDVVGEAPVLWENELEAIHCYRSLCMIRKR